MDAISNFVTYMRGNEALTGWLIAIAIALAIFIGGRWLSKRVVRVTRSIMLGREVDETLINFLGRVLYATLMTVVIVTSLSYIGVPVTGVAAIIGAAGLAIGLALKDSLSNFAQGVMLIIFQPFKKGHFVDLGGISGSVEEIRIFNTVLKTGDNKQVTIPNAIVGSGSITNYSIHDTRRIDFVIGVSYDDDLKLARDVLTRICKDHPLILDEPKTNVFVSNLGDSSVDISVRPWVKTADYSGAYGELLESFKVELEAAGCNLPYPQTDVHLHQTD